MPTPEEAGRALVKLRWSRSGTKGLVRTGVRQSIFEMNPNQRQQDPGRTSLHTKTKAGPVTKINR